MDEESIRDYLPTSFGGSNADYDIETQIEKTRRPGFAKKSAQRDADPADDDNDNSSDSDDSEDDEDEYPVSHELVFKTHDRAVTTITLDTSGARMITGSTDCTLKFHDFSSMAPNTIRAFKSVDPTATKGSANTETHPIHVARFNPGAGNQVLVIGATPQARILSRDGETEYETVKGDMYLRDMNMTKGHVSEITSGTWHPTNGDRFITAGTDSTLRIWDINLRTKQADIIVHKSRQAGSAGRSRMTAVAWGSAVEGTNSMLVAAALDGSLLMWGGEGPYHRPAAEIKEAHKSETWTSGIDMSSDGRLVVTRGGDDTVKTWDTRKFKTPITTIAHPSTSQQYPSSNIIFAPNSSAILTGSPTGDLHILNPATLQPILITPITPSSPLITVHYNPVLNQILTGSANAQTTILFNPHLSTPHKGALSILSRAPKRRHIDDDAALTTSTSDNPSIIPGDSTSSISKPQTGLTASGKSRDPRRPHIPMQTPFSKSQPDEKHIKASIPFSSMREEDPREALLKYAEKARDDPMFTKAWKKTQPETIYADVSGDEEGGEEEEGGVRKKRKV